MSECIAGCSVFTNGEVKHHADCPKYIGSWSEMYSALERELAEANQHYATEMEWNTANNLENSKLETANAKLTAEVERLKSASCYVELCDKLDKATADVAELREALERICNQDMGLEWNNCGCESIAKQALAKTEERA